MDKTLEGQDMLGGQLRCAAFQISCAQEMSAKQILKPWGSFDTDSNFFMYKQIDYNLQIQMAMVDIQVEIIINNVASGWLFPIQFFYNIMPLRPPLGIKILISIPNVDPECWP